jgi:hypothetical protein
MCLQTAAMWLRDRRCFLPILYVFERGHKHETEADAVLKAIARHDESRRLFRYRNHVFEPKTEHGLQAADLFAWTVTKVMIGGGRSRAMQPFKKPLRWLSDHDNGRSHIHSFTGELLRRFFQEQVAIAGTPTVIADVGPRRRSFR